ncbi:MAG: acetyl-CoA carboxylase [Dehalococcoidia bacterium]|nr:MAG: acetyl-CoA carboxylase [Dehalococcoidia bacterium]
MVSRLPEFLARFGPHRREEEPAPGEPALLARCPHCGSDLSTDRTYRRFRVCSHCRFHFPLPARERVELLADPGTFRETNRGLRAADPLAFADRLPYRERLADARRRTGLSEAVITGVCRIGGRPLVLAVLDFDFLGGSMGSATGEKIARAFEHATREKLPIVTIATSGGARMQEGILALMQMAKTVAAAKRHHSAGLPYLSVLTHPTTGGIYASFASLGDVTLAEPGALIGFAGPRVIEQTIGQQLPPGAQRPEFLLAHGQLDLIVDRLKLRGVLAELLALMTSPYRLTAAGASSLSTVASRAEETPWQTVQLARHTQRPTTLDYIQRMTSGFIELHGDRLSGDDPAIVGGLAELAGQPVVILGHERGHPGSAVDRREGRALPEGYRKARRLMLLAAKLRLPLVTLIDTPGAYPGLEAEERGLAHALALCLATMVELPTPIVSVVIGEGGSGGALALGVADRVLMQEHAIYSVIAPEGAAAILYHDASRAEELAGALRLTARDCKALGVVDALVAEPAGGAHTDPEAAAHLVKTAVVHELVALQRHPIEKLLAWRYKKFRAMGETAAPVPLLDHGPWRELRGASA